MFFINRHLIALLLTFSYLLVYNSNYSIVNADDSLNPAKSIVDRLLLRTYNFSDADSILKYSFEALDISRSNNISVANSLFAIGDGYFQSGKHSIALEYFLEAANEYEKENNKLGKGAVYSSIALIYISQNNHKNAIFYLNAAANIFRSQKDSLRLAGCINNLGYEFFKSLKYDTSLYLFNEAITYYQALNLNYETAYALGNSGLVLLRKDELKEAKFRLNSAMDTLTKYNDDYGKIEFIIAYSEVLQIQGKPNEALTHAQEAYQLAEVNNISEFKRDAAFRLSEIYNELENHQDAYQYHKEFTALSDSIKNFKTIQRMADLRTEFEVSQKQAEVDILTKRRAIQLIIIGSLGVIVLLALWLILVYRRNLHRSKEFMRVLRNQQAELKELNHIKDRFFSIISHDLRSPISSLGGISFMIKESLENNNDEMLKQAVDYIDQTVLSLTNLLDNLLNWALSQQGKLRYTEEQLNVSELIEEIVSQFTTLTLLKEIKITLDLEKNLYVMGDANTLLTVIRNLLSNALKFTPKGKEVRLACTSNDNKQVQISVIDQGVGIPEDKLTDLFALKENKSTRGTENEKGLGLGLNLVQEFVQQNKGTIDVESKVGEGTCFVLEFPAS